jgi:uncharacterized protein YjiS (DUF1127 family)
MTTYTQNCHQIVEQGSIGVFARLNQILQQWFGTQLLKVRVNQERAELLAMSDSMLRDMGITRAQAVAEAQRVDLPEARLNALASKKC